MSLPPCVCVYVRETNWRKVNRCEEEQADTLLSEVLVGVMGIEGEGMCKLPPFFISKGADGLIPAPDPLILLRGMRGNKTVKKIANKEFTENLKNNNIEQRVLFGTAV